MIQALIRIDTRNRGLSPSLVFDIAKDIGMVLNSDRMKWSAAVDFNPRNSLIGDVIELARSVDELLPDLAGKFDRCKKIADTEAKAHRDLERGLHHPIRRRVRRYTELFSWRRREDDGFSLAEPLR
jgi:hypothetical protein